MNLPPFYIGQKIVALNDFAYHKKHGFNTPITNTVYTVRGLRYLEGKNSMIWCVDLVEVRNEIRKFAGGVVGEISWSAKEFIEVETIKAKLELSKVLEKVNEFVCAN